MVLALNSKPICASKIYFKIGITHFWKEIGSKKNCYWRQRTFLSNLRIDEFTSRNLNAYNYVL